MKTARKIGLGLLVLVVVGFLWPADMLIPVQGGTSNDWNKDTFWYEPWGRSGVHKGIDIFANRNQPVIAPTDGLVIYTGTISVGGNVVLVLGPKWRLHYFAHLESVSAGGLSLVRSGSVLGQVGDSGNAQGKPPHLHYSVVTMFPYFWRIDRTTQGWKKMFYLDPGALLNGE